MPAETQAAVDWALTQEYFGFPVTKDNAIAVVDKVREYFNAHEIEYETFSYDDLLPYLN